MEEDCGEILILCVWGIMERRRYYLYYLVEDHRDVDTMLRGIMEIY